MEKDSLAWKLIDVKISAAGSLNTGIIIIIIIIITGIQVLMWLSPHLADTHVHTDTIMGVYAQTHPLPQWAFTGMCAHVHKQNIHAPSRKDEMVQHKTLRNAQVRH